MNIRSKLKDIRAILGDTFHRFPVSILFIAVFSIINIVSIFTENYNYELEEAIVTGSLLAIFCETLKEYKLFEKQPFIFGIPVVFTALCYFVLEQYDNIYTKIGVGGIAIAILAGIFFIYYRKRENKLIFSHIIKTEFICSLATNIIYSGLCVCLMAFNFLIFKFDDIWKYLGALAIIVMVFMNIVLFISFLPKPDSKITIPKIYRTIIHKGLFYIYLLLIGILYLYIIKVIIIHKMPVGKFNWFGCFSLLFFVFFYLSVDEEDGIIQEKFKSYGALLMIPVLIMQTLGLYIRISSYGLTVARYLSIILILTAIVFIINSLLKKPVKYSFIGVVIAALLFSCTPLNIIDTPNRSQEHILRNTLSAAGVLNSDSTGKDVIDDNVKINNEYLNRAKSAYEYLHDSEGTKSEFFNKVENSKLKEQLEGAGTVENNINFSYYKREQKLNISQYNTLEYIYEEEPEFQKKDMTEFFLSLDEDSKQISYKTDDAIIYFTSIDYIYSNDDEEFQYINWEGYLLEK